MDHHLHSDSPRVIAIRSRLRFANSQLNASMHHKRMRASPICLYCPAVPENLGHVLLACPMYATARALFLATIGFRPPDDKFISICLACTGDRFRRGRRPSLYESASAASLLEIDRLRPEV